MTALLEIERKMGRQRRRKKDHAIIDIDILFAGDRVVDTPS